MSIYKQIRSDFQAASNAKILTGFLTNYQRDDVRKTHLFEGRYENIYLDSGHIPELTPLVKQATRHAEDILQVKGLRAGFWFNFMPPGSSTLAHSHDDDDELLSGVYYVEVPEDSGNLVIYDDSSDATDRRVEIKSQTGDFIFFKPDVRHEVTRNNSQRHRLSIGFNFGRKKD